MRKYTLDYLLSEAAKFRDAVGRRSVMQSHALRDAAFKAITHVALRCDDPKADAIFRAVVDEYAWRCALLDLQEEAQR